MNTITEQMQDVAKLAREQAELQHVIATAPAAENVTPGKPIAKAADPLFQKLIDGVVGDETDEQRARRAKAMDDEARRKRDLLWRDLCPKNLQHTDWDDARLRPYKRQIERVRGWQAGASGLYIMGRTGRGKSRAFWSLMRALMIEGHKLRVVRQTDVTNVLNREPKLFVEQMAELRYVEILAWDDWGKFSVIDARVDTMHAEMEALIDIRTSNGMPMIITTNCRDDDVTRMFGILRAEPILRRIGESCRVVDFGWD